MVAMGTVGILELLGTLVALTSPNQLSFLLQLLTINAHLAAKKMLRSDRSYFYNTLAGPEDWNVGKAVQKSYTFHYKII